MKHTQIRHNCFETNSSSTHAYTVNTGRGNAKATFRPILTEEPIRVRSGFYGDDDWQNKLSGLVGFLYLQGRLAEIEKVADTFEKFCGTRPTFNFDAIKESMEHPKWPLDMEGFFEEFSPRGPYDDCYGNKPEELESFFNMLLLKEDDIVAFVCSTGWIEVNEYYDG